MKKLPQDSQRQKSYASRKVIKNTLTQGVQNLCYAFLYIAAYWCLDAFSFISHIDKIDITPWNPPVAASFILLYYRGISWWPLLFVANLSFQLLYEHIDAPLYLQIATATAETLIYTAAVWLIKDRFKINKRLTTLRDITVFASVSTLSALFMGITYVLTYFYAGLISYNDLGGLSAEYCAADSLGLLTLTPIVLINWPITKPIIWLKHFRSYGALCEYIFTAILIFFVIWAEQKGLRLIFTIFIPVIWVAVRHGLKRTSSLIPFTQIMTILFTWAMNTSPNTTVKFLPFIMIVITWTGLILGAVIDEREHIKLSNLKNDARLKAILDMAPDCMLIVDMQGYIVTANRNFVQLYGVERFDILAGVHIEKIIPTFYPELNGETFILLADGKDIPIEISSSKVPVGDKFSSILTIRDITSRKLAEVQIRQKRAATEEATRINLTGSLAAVLAHELNQPLSAIISYSTACTNILETVSPKPPARIAEQLSKITIQAQRAGTIIRRLREFFQNSTLEITKVDISELVDETLMLLEDQIINAQIDVETQIADHLYALIDRIQTEQVLINLVKNSIEALKNAPKGQKRIRITANLSMRGDIEITVTDTGTGIAEEIADQLFNPFVTTRLSGMGLGLTISRSIIEAHNGRLWAELQSSSGAAMHFTIPAYRET